jgi:hypothetical protein
VLTGRIRPAPPTPSGPEQEEEDMSEPAAETAGGGGGRGAGAAVADAGPASGACSAAVQAQPALDEPEPALDAACRLLLSTGAPTTVDAVAAESGLSVEDAGRALAAQERRGRLGRLPDGRIVASAGVSVVPSEYEVRVGQRQFWAWCAKTALGVVGAVGIGGSILSRSPLTGRELRAEFAGGSPVTEQLWVFWPSTDFRDSCASATDEYCSVFTMFESAEAARTWVAARQLPGEVLPVKDAAVRARARWVTSLDLPGRGRSLPTTLSCDPGSD